MRPIGGGGGPEGANRKFATGGKPRRSRKKVWLSPNFFYALATRSFPEYTYLLFFVFTGGFYGIFIE